MHYFFIYFKKFNKPFVNFLRVLDEKHILLGNFENIFKNFDENSIENLNFYFGKFVTKNWAFWNNTIFIQQFFSVSGGGGFPFPLWLGPWSHPLPFDNPSLSNPPRSRISILETSLGHELLRCVGKFCCVGSNIAATAYFNFAHSSAHFSTLLRNIVIKTFLLRFSL